MQKGTLKFHHKAGATLYMQVEENGALVGGFTFKTGSRFAARLFAASFPRDGVPCTYHFVNGNLEVLTVKNIHI